MYIASFPTENDRRNIKLLLEGFADLEDILCVFHRDLFFVSDSGDKAQIMHLLASYAEKKFCEIIMLTQTSAPLPSVYKNNKHPELNFTRLKELAAAVPIPLVLHGNSGTLRRYINLLSK